MTIAAVNNKLEIKVTARPRVIKWVASALELVGVETNGALTSATKAGENIANQHK